MKKTYKIEVDCANCANLVEAAIKKVAGVKDASVVFMTQKMKLEAEDDVFDDVLKKAVKEISKVEPDCTVII